MSFKFKITDRQFIMNFSESFVTTPQELLASDGFIALLDLYMKHVETHNYDIAKYFSIASRGDFNKIKMDCHLLLRLLIIMDAEEIRVTYSELSPYLQDLRMVLRTIEGLYLFWRKYQRFGLIINKETDRGFEDVSFVEAQDIFQNLILTTYRKIEVALGHENQVYRQIIAGVNAAISLNTGVCSLPNPYNVLDKVPIVEKVTIHPPFITHSKQRKRDGVFNEVDTNPIIGKNFNPDEWYCYPVRVGSLVAFVYFHEQFMALGTSLCNLFSMAEKHEYKDKHPDLIFVFGYDDGELNQCFYDDKENNIVFGYISLNEHFDYFGYLKKMILTLHNIYMLNSGKLPIHGAMIELSLIDGRKKSIIIVGDSGAGKSETIEQLKSNGKKYVNEIKTVYDDMGVLYIDENGNVVSSGTEIGAFIRLDDLDNGVGYKEIDRSVFVNPDKTNARIITPVSFWRDIANAYKVEAIVYANNYEDGNDVLTFFDNFEEAISKFVSGKRMSKGTTTEKGITESFFANPFGPAQRQEQTKPLLEKYFKLMFEQGIKVGEIKTKLGIQGQEKSGPTKAAYDLSMFIGS